MLGIQEQHGGGQRWPPWRMAAAALVAVMALACEHDPADWEDPDPVEDVPTLARRLLMVEVGTAELIAWAKAPGTPDAKSRLEALDSLVAHIHRTTGYLKESARDPASAKAARAGVHLAWLSYDFMRIDAEATIQRRSAVARKGCNRGQWWVGIGMQGLAKGPAWADNDAERLMVYVQAEGHRENVLRVMGISGMMSTGVAFASLFSAAWSTAVLTGIGVAAIERLAVFAARGGGGMVALRAVPSLTGGAALEFVTSTAGATALTHGEAVALFAAGTLGANAAALYMMASGLPPKPIDPKAFAEWIEKAPKQPSRTGKPEHQYEIDKTGKVNIEVAGGGEVVAADGARAQNAHLLEAKYVGKPDQSPFVDGSRCPAEIRKKILEEVEDEFRRYAAVIRDPATPAVGLEVIVNEARAIPYFERLMRQFGIPGQVVVSP